MSCTITVVRVLWSSVAVLVLLAPLVGCQQPAKGEPPAQSSPEVRREGDSEPDWTIGWSQLKAGMDAVEVLSLLNGPQHIKVTKVNTTWYYSDRRADGPHVVFDTRQMRVEGWRSPQGR
ncbi:MAG: hypothetical protein KKB50_15460 [Planctomycetes bacterium]|nr:hypothetical protein [Planctomycetota bacterium]